MRNCCRLSESVNKTKACTVQVNNFNFACSKDHFMMFQGGWTALMWACYKGRTEVARVLLEHGANCNVKGEVCCKFERYKLNVILCMLFAFPCIMLFLVYRSKNVLTGNNQQ